MHPSRFLFDVDLTPRMRDVSLAFGVASCTSKRPARFIGCDYELNSLIFLPTAPGPKLI